MDERRRRIITIISSMSALTLVHTLRPLYGLEPIPEVPPVPNPPPPTIQRAEALILDALKKIPEDKSLTMEEILTQQSALRAVSEQDMHLSILDLRFHSKIEECDGDFPPPEEACDHNGTATRFRLWRHIG